MFGHESLKPTMLHEKKDFRLSYETKWYYMNTVNWVAHMDNLT